jgi:peptidoglycan/LPS O-acetylase OafA/YrhL
MKKKLINHIQFLRAISVLFVFFYHLKLSYFEYGFIGVDIFFVISGYVITSRIYNEYLEFKKFNFLKFYKKRINRIYPVLFFIFSFTLIFIILFQPLDLFLNNLKVYFFTIFGISNLYYLFSSKDYFDTVFEDPYAHSWSLGVEEQFYLLFPILFIIILKYIKKINLNIILISLIIIIGVIFTYLFSNDGKTIFYSPLFRFWQFLLGSLIFLISTKIEKKNLIISILIFLSLITFIIKGKIFDSVTLTLLSSILASLFILFYEDKKYGKLFFENIFLVFIGNISYSFYLWHLPIIYFYNLYFGDTFFKTPLLFFITLTLSSLSFFYIEERFRYKKLNVKFNKKKIFYTMSFLLIIILSVNYFAFQKSYNNDVKKEIKKIFYKLNYLENKKRYTDRTVFYKINISGNQIYRFCTEKSKNYNLNKNNLRIECLSDKKKSKRLLHFEGNSQTANFVPMMQSNKFVDSFYYLHNGDLLNKINHKYINSLTNFYDEVIYGTHINSVDELETLMNISKAFNNKIKILILGPIPHIDNSIDPLKCFIRSIECSYKTSNDIDNRKLKKFYLVMDKILLQQNNFFFYNPYKIICPEDTCYIYSPITDLLTHRDNTHLTIEGSLLLREDFLNFYKINFDKTLH